MKKYSAIFLTAITAITLVGCGSNDPSIKENFVENASTTNQIVLNLTSVGLYKGQKGNENLSYFLENSITLDANVGDLLPTKEDITCTTADTEFKTWIYYDKGGILSSTDKVVRGVYEYQAHFEFVGEFINNDTPDTPAGNEQKIYFITSEWWQKDGATTSFYSWGGNTSYQWPGKVMHLEETLSNKRQVWSVVADINSFTGFIFARTGSGAAEGTTAADWGAKTPDLTAAKFGSNNCAIVSNDVIWGNPGVNLTYATYVPGKTDY